MCDPIVFLLIVAFDEGGADELDEVGLAVDEMASYRAAWIRMTLAHDAIPKQTREALDRCRGRRYSLLG